MSELVNFTMTMYLDLESSRVSAHLLPSPWAKSALIKFGAPSSRVVRFSK